MVRFFSRAAILLALIVGVSVDGLAEPRPRHDLIVEAGPLPEILDSGVKISVPVLVTNNGFEPWSSDDGFAFSYHWFGEDGEVAVWDGHRTALPRAIDPGESLSFDVDLESPPTAGRFLLVWDLVQEGVLWVSEVDSTPVVPIPVTVRSSRAFALLDGRPPRLMRAGSQVVIRIELRNDGTRSWPSDGDVNASYQWLDLSGGRVHGKGHNVYLEGRRTPFSAEVIHGDVTEVQLVVAAPPGGGLYRLQIDVIEEHVCWFSDVQTDPPPARLVMVVGDPLATPGWWAFLSLAAAAAAVTTLQRRGPRVLVGFFAIADAVWLIGSVTLKQSFVLHDHGLEPTGDGWVLMIAGSAAVALATRLLPARLRGWACWVLVLVATALLWGDAIYLRFFGDLPGIAALSSVGQLGQVEASVRSLMVAGDLWLWLDLFPGLVLVLVAGRLRQGRSPWLQRVLACFLLVLTVIGVGAANRIGDSDGRRLRQVFRRVRVAKQIGVLNLHAFEIGRRAVAVFGRAGLSPEEKREIVDWFRERAPARAGVGPWFGAADGMNLIMIQVESLQGFVVGLEIEGREVTPFLNRWRDEVLWFSNFGDQTLDGRSSDSEFATQVSLLPSSGGAAAFLHADNDFTGLAEVLAGEGYRTLSAVPFDGSFWNRRTTHRAYGFAESLFTEDFSDGEMIGWGLNDRDFLHQMALRLGQTEEPFAAYLLTLSLHHPFDGFPAHLQTLDVGQWEGTPFGNFLHTMHFFDQSLAAFVVDLKSSGLGENTVIAIWGDHDAGFRWQSEIADAIGHTNDNVGWYLSQEIPLFLAVPDRKEDGGERTISAGHVDVGPTLMALLGVDPAPYAFIGRNLLGAPGDHPVIGEFDCWRDSRRLFIRGGGSLEDGQCVDTTDLTVLPISECAPGFAEAETIAEMSATVLEHNLQREIHLGLAGENE